MEDERSDGLEIVSIGKLYFGAWDKKYWSSSRGKDRYPFPIGYKALRAQNGITYQMEIHEGSKGPSFLITSSDGHSCSGQTPDMAWEIFQKKGCPRIKLWHGKRFSCKIDGVEFFGFKNAFVQRLLRELGTHNSVTTEHSSITPGSLNEDSAKKIPSSCAESCTKSTDPAPLTNFAKSPVKGKRGRKLKSFNPNPADAASCKKSRPKDEVPNDRVSHENEVHNNQMSDPGPRIHNNSEHEPLLVTSASNEEQEIHNDNRASAMSFNLETVIEEKGNYFSVNNDLPVTVTSCHSSDHHSNGEEPPHREDKLVNYIPKGTTESLSIYENPLNRSTTENEESSLSKPEEPVNGEMSVAKDSEGIKDVDRCIPDSLDSLHDRTCDSQSNTQKEKDNPRNMKCELVAGIGSVVIFEITASQSYQEEETITSNANSEKSDFDSVGEDIAKSMMSFLLPQALPLLSSKKKSPILLKTFSRKRRRVLKPPANISGKEEMQKENKETCNRDGICPEGVHAKDPLLDREEATVVPDSLDVFSSGHEATVVPDGFINEEALYDVPAELAIIDDNENRPHKLRLPARSNALEKSSMGHDGTSFNDKKCEGQKVSIENCNVIKSESVVGGLSFTENNIYRSKDEMCKNRDNFLCHEIHSKEKELKTSLGNNKGATADNSAGTLSSWEVLQNVISAKTSELTGNSSFTENSNAGDLTRQNKGPLSESIICRTSADVSALEAYAASELMLPSDSHPVGSLAPDVVGTIHPVSKHQEFGFPLNNKVNADLLDLSASCSGTSRACVGNESLRHPNYYDEENVSIEKAATSSSRYDRGVEEGPWVKPQMKIGHFNKHGNIHFVGRYIHPFPISLVLLSTNEEEACICVLCDSSVDQERKLFLYKLSTKEQMFGPPAFIGHTTLFLPILRDAFRREISMDRTCLQLTPDGQSLVILNSVKAPWCREGDLQCPCSACISSSNKNPGLKVVQVKKGYVSVVMKLMTAENVQCILVCEPNYLIGIEESGILHLWVMNSTWSALVEECDLSTSDCIFPCIVELKRIPNHSALVLGHNGFGEFGLWDINKRIFVTRFSSSSTSVYQFLPISVFRWQKKESTFTKPHSQGKDMVSTGRSSSKQDENQSCNLMQGDDVAIWILISTICNIDAQHKFRATDHKMNTVGLWRLALVVGSTVIMGSALDHRAASVGVLSDNGIIGTNDGAIYMWDLSTGTKLCDLHHFQGVSVSCIATDNSRLGPIAIAGRDQLLVYVHSQKGLSNATSNEQEIQP